MATESTPQSAAFQFSSFVPIPPFPVHAPKSTYMSQEGQHVWARAPPQTHKRKRENYEDKMPLDQEMTEEKRGRNTIVFHPGTRLLKVGRATDIMPLLIPHVIARRTTAKLNPTFLERIRRPTPLRREKAPVVDEPPDENTKDNDVIETDPPQTEQLDEEAGESNGRFTQFRQAFKERTKLYGVRHQNNFLDVCTTFNRAQTPEKIPDHQDSQKVNWITNPPQSVRTYVGQKVFLLADPPSQGFNVRWPFHGIHFNKTGYSSHQELLSDVETIWTTTIEEELHIRRSELKNYSAILVVPDLSNRLYIRDLVHVLLTLMNFKQVAVHQEGVCTGYGAQMTFGCLVDIGATKTSICCLEDSLIVPDTRIVLNTGGDDVTEMLYVLLQQVCFPYKEVDLVQLYHWQLFEDLKQSQCTLAPGAVGSKTLDITIRTPGSPAMACKIKMYDEHALAPSLFFETTVVKYSNKRLLWNSGWNQDIQEDLSNAPGEEITHVMYLSTKHIILDVNDEETRQISRAQAAAQAEAEKNDEKVDEEKLAQIAEDGWPSQPERRKPSNLRQESPPLIFPRPMRTKIPGGYAVDVPFEASKLPLDVAVFNSTRGLKSAEQSKRYLNNVLLVGGGSMLADFGIVLQQRLQAIAGPYYQYTSVEACQVLSAPKEIDSRAVAWKGASVLARLEASSEFWVTQAEWDLLGMRAFRDRSFFL